VKKKRVTGIVAFVGLVIPALLILTGCTSQPAITSAPVIPDDSPTLKSTKMTPQPGDNGSVSSALLVPMDIDKLIIESDCVLIGKVTDILPARETTEDLLPGFAESGMKMVYTDVIIQPERYFFGNKNTGDIAVHVEGGRIGNYTLIAEDQPVFTEGESVLVFLKLYPFSSLPQGILSSNYFKVKGLTQGKYHLQNGKYVESFSGKELSITDLKQKILNLRK
jgi:hypothetical protein